MQKPRSLLLVGLALIAALALAGHAGAGPKKLPALTPLAPDGLSRALASGQISEGTYALERAKVLFRPSPVRARYGTVRTAPPDAATLILRDLAARLPLLSPSEQKQARSILARPTDGPMGDPQGTNWTAPQSAWKQQCPTGKGYCIHWVDPTWAGAGEVDEPPNQAWIDTTETILDQVLQTEVTDLGFPFPEDDATSSASPSNPTGTAAVGNPNGKLDVYLADIGDEGLYGYCTTDDPRASDLNPSGFDVSAYCVVDNDFAKSQFSSGAFGQNANRVTLAHEVHHAEQYALDWLEDTWLLEADATFMERVVFPAIHDNYQYFAESPITEPSVPLDYGNTNFLNVYGDWIFLEYLSEHFGGPEISRTIWTYLDGRANHPDQYSIQGVASFLHTKNTTLNKTFAGFALANRWARKTYAIGSGFPKQKVVSPVTKSYSLGPGATRKSGSWRIKHLASRWISFWPRSNASKHGHLRLGLALPPYSAARAVVINKSGTRSPRTIPLNGAGDGHLRLPFQRGTVQRIDLLLSNTSARFVCWEATFYSCSGRPKDDRRMYHITASLN